MMSRQMGQNEIRITLFRMDSMTKPLTCLLASTYGHRVGNSVGGHDLLYSPSNMSERPPDSD